MASRQENSIHSTTKTLINTVGKVRELVNNLFHYNPATTTLNDVQIRWLLRSPLESVIKNILVFEMVYAAVKDNVKQHALDKLLEKIGLKEFAALYHEWLLKRKLAEPKPSIIPEFIQQVERYSVTPRPVLKPKKSLAELTLRLDDLRAALALIANEISNLFVRKQLLLNNLIFLNQSHVNTIRSLGQGSGISLLPEQIMTVLPEVHTAYRVAISPQDQIRALGRFIDDNASMNYSALHFHRFLSSTALGTAFSTYDDELGIITTEFTQVNEALMHSHMRQSDLMTQIQEVESMIEQLRTESASSSPTTPKHAELSAPQFSASDIESLLTSYNN